MSSKPAGSDRHEDAAAQDRDETLREFAAALDAFTTEWWGRVEYEPAAEVADPRLPHLDRRSWRDRDLSSVFRKLRQASEDLAGAIESEEAESNG